MPAALATPPGNRGGMVRSVPDISADADPFTGFAVGYLTFHNKSGRPPGPAHQQVRRAGLSPAHPGRPGGPVLPAASPGPLSP